MLRGQVPHLSEFVPSDKLSHSLKDKNGIDWYIKFTGNLESVQEVIVSRIHRLLSGEAHVPEVILVKGFNPDIKEDEYAVASKIIDRYMSFLKMPISYDDDLNLLVGEKRSFEGFERLAIASCIMGETDFAGLGNIGFDLDSVGSLKLMRIDFGKNLFFDKTEDFDKCQTLEEMFILLDAGGLIRFNMLNGDLARDALRNISKITDQEIESIFTEFLPYLEDATAVEILRLQQKINNTTDDSDRNTFEQIITQKQQFMKSLLKKKEVIINNKNKTSSFLLSLKDPEKEQSYYFSTHSPNIPIASHEDYQSIKSFFSIYNSFVGNLSENYVNRKTRNFLLAVTSSPEQAAEEIHKIIVHMNNKIARVEARLADALEYESTGDEPAENKENITIKNLSMQCKPFTSIKTIIQNMENTLNHFTKPDHSSEAQPKQ